MQTNGMKTSKGLNFICYMSPREWSEDMLLLSEAETCSGTEWAEEGKLGIGVGHQNELIIISHSRSGEGEWAAGNY